jgi:hypothetical protein
LFIALTQHIAYLTSRLTCCIAVWHHVLRIGFADLAHFVADYWMVRFEYLLLLHFADDDGISCQHLLFSELDVDLAYSATGLATSTRPCWTGPWQPNPSNTSMTYLLQLWLLFLQFSCLDEWWWWLRTQTNYLPQGLDPPRC